MVTDRVIRLISIPSRVMIINEQTEKGMQKNTMIVDESSGGLNVILSWTKMINDSRYQR